MNPAIARALSADIRHAVDGIKFDRRQALRFAADMAQVWSPRSTHAGFVSAAATWRRHARAAVTSEGRATFVGFAKGELDHARSMIRFGMIGRPLP